MLFKLFSNLVDRINKRYSQNQLQEEIENEEIINETTDTIDKLALLLVRLKGKELRNLSYTQLRSWYADTYSGDFSSLVQLVITTKVKMINNDTRLNQFLQSKELKTSKLHDWFYGGSGTVKLDNIRSTLAIELEDLLDAYENSTLSPSNKDRYCLYVTHDIENLLKVIDHFEVK